MKKAFLWDAAQTLFIEKMLDKKYKDPDDYARRVLKVDPNDNRQNEQADEKVYADKKLTKISLPRDFKKVLSKTKYNFVVTTGTEKQTWIRRQRILEDGGPDIKKYLKGVISSFDYHQDTNDNRKNQEFFEKVFKELKKKDFSQFIYADDKIESCQQFLKAGGSRSYNILHGQSKIAKISKNFWKVGNLREIWENEERIK